MAMNDDRNMVTLFEEDSGERFSRNQVKGLMMFCLGPVPEPIARRTIKTVFEVLDQPGSKLRALLDRVSLDESHTSEAVTPGPIDAAVVKEYFEARDEYRAMYQSRAVFSTEIADRYERADAALRAMLQTPGSKS